MTCNTAVFYDVENLITLFNPKSSQTLQLDEIHRRILALEAVKGISIQKAYADWATPSNRNLRSFILQIGIEPVQIFNTNQKDKLKNAADVNLIIDAVELLMRNPEIENYVIASGDGIFAFLAKKLHSYGKRVIGCGFDHNSNIIFKNACDIFLELEQNDASLTATIKNAFKGTILTTPVIHADDESSEEPIKPILTPAKPSNKAVHKLPKTKFTEALVNSDIPIWRNTRDFQGSLRILKRIINVLFSKPLEDENGEIDLEISVLKTYVDHYMPNLRIRHYGFKRFSEFIRFLLTSSPYCLTVSEGTVVRIVQRDIPHENVMPDIDGVSFTLTDGSVANSIFDLEDNVHFIFNTGKDTKKVTKPEETENLPDEIVYEEQEEKIEITEKITEEIPEELSEESPEEAPEEPIESIRKWVKNSFTKLSQDNNLTAKELKKLTAADYSQKTFGVTVPVLKEIKSRANLREQRQENGRVKYWKEEFSFDGKSYFVFKEWTEKAHRNKFGIWLEGVKTD